MTMMIRLQFVTIVLIAVTCTLGVLLLRLSGATLGIARNGHGAGGVSFPMGGPLDPEALAHVSVGVEHYNNKNNDVVDAYVVVDDFDFDDDVIIADDVVDDNFLDDDDADVDDHYDDDDYDDDYNDDDRGAEDDCYPSHIHWSPATNVDIDHQVSMTVSFTLNAKNEECATASAYVKYGRVGLDEEFHAFPSERFQFQHASTHRTFSSPWVHHTVLDNLEAGLETYWYRIQVVIQDNTTVISSPTYSITTPPLPGQPARIAIVGDWGGEEASVQTMNGMLQTTFENEGDGLSTSAVIIAGDLSYANGYLPYWETWMERMEPLFRRTSLMVAPGNHELECDQKSFVIFQAYESYFRNPNRLGPAEILPASYSRTDCTDASEFLAHYIYGNSFYTVTHGLVQLFVLNSYVNTTQGSVQYEWLKHEFESLNRTSTPWVVVVFHCPLHTTFYGHNNEMNPNMMMQDMEPLLVKHHVNLVFSGHNHAYVRTHSMIGTKVDVSHRGPVYLTVGTGGISHSDGPLQPSPEVWVAHRDNTEFGFGDLQVFNATHAYFVRKLNAREDANPDAQDQVWFFNQLARQ